jgi:hypothetical protein
LCVVECLTDPWPAPIMMTAKKCLQTLTNATQCDVGSKTDPYWEPLVYTYIALMFYFSFFLTVLGFELRALHLLVRPSTM